MYKLKTWGRGLRMLTDTSRPVLAQVVVTRKCNLSCGYCNEYDKVSPPVESRLLERYIDHLADLGTVIITFTGGEPLLHPELDKMIARVARHNMVCTSITNGYLLSKEWVQRLNDSGLELLQLSIDNLNANESSQKSFNLLQKKLALLQDATFKVNINAVLGSCPIEETRELAREVQAMGFYMTVGLMHGGDGSLDPGLLEYDQIEPLYIEMQGYRKRSVEHRFGEGWEFEMIRTGQSDWKCRAGARYLYIDEHGIVSYCSQRRGEPGIPILEYTAEDTRSYFTERKGCEEQCTVACVRRASSFDTLRLQESEPRGQSSKVPLPIVVS